jgi:hypothetical protein
MQPESKPFLTAGEFCVGCNYWASHAGTATWFGWRPEIVREDLARLAAAGLQVLRVFPLWSDFQPLHLLRTYASNPVEFRHGEAPLPDHAALRRRGPCRQGLSVHA